MKGMNPKKGVGSLFSLVWDLATMVQIPADPLNIKFIN